MESYYYGGNDHYYAPNTKLELGSASRLQDSRPRSADYGQFNAVFESTVAAAGTFLIARSLDPEDEERRVIFASSPSRTIKNSPSATSPAGSQGEMSFC